MYLNSTTVECVPRATCKPICMELEGIVYSEGDLMEEDECHRYFNFHFNLEFVFKSVIFVIKY